MFDIQATEKKTFYLHSWSHFALFYNHVHWKRAGIMKLNLQKEKGAKVMQTFHLADGLGLE